MHTHTPAVLLKMRLGPKIIQYTERKVPEITFHNLSGCRDSLVQIETKYEKKKDRVFFPRPNSFTFTPAFITAYI